MLYGAIDLHMRYSQIRIVDAEGHIVREQRAVTGAARLVTVFSARVDADSARDRDRE